MRTHNEIWSAVQKRCPKSRREAIPELRSFLLGLNNPHAILLSGVLPTAATNSDSARHLEEAVAEHYRKHPKFSKADAANWLSLIASAVTEYISDGAAVSQTWVVPFAGPAPSIFNEIAVEDATEVLEWRQALHQWIINDAASASRREFQAAVLLSSLLHGMLIDTVKIKRLLRHLCRNIEPEVSMGFAAISFRLPFDGLGDHHLQRWHLDTVTEMLYWRAIKLNGADLETDEIYETVKRILIGNHTNGGRLPKQFPKLVKITATWWATRSSQIEIQTSSRGIQAHAFPDTAWARLCATPSPNKPTYIRSLPNENIGEEKESPADTLDQDELCLLFPWFGTAVSALEDEKDAKVVLAKLDAALPPGQGTTTPTYVEWLKWLLQGKSSAGGPLALSTIRKRFFVTASQLLLVLGESNPADLCTPALADIYAELTGDPLPDIPVSHLKEGLRDFHAFLVQTLGHPALERESEVLGNDASLKPVDGNVISFDDYLVIQSQLKQQLAQRNVTLEEFEICQIVLMLAFRTGLRRMEIFGLRLSDIQTEVGLTLIINPHEFRGLKTTSSERVIPLRAFLSLEERLLLKRFVGQRRRAEQCAMEPNDLLFWQFGEKNSETWVAKIYKIIRDAIRTVTGDDALYMHHLRHSFGSWTYLRLRIPDFPDLLEHFEHLPATKKALQTGAKLRLLLLHQSTEISRKYGYLVARLLGHSSPVVSLGHYIHCCDLIAGAIASRETQLIEQQVLVAASGLPKSTAYENLANGYQQLLIRIRQRNQQQAASPNAESRQRGAPRKEESDEISQQWISFQLQLDVLAILAKPGASKQTACDALQVAPALVDRIVEAMTVHGRRFSVIDRQGCPANPPLSPRIHEDKEFFFELEKRLKRLYASDPKLFVKGIEIHLSHVVLQKNDVLFQGKDEFQLLKAYLRFMKALGIEAKQLRWVFRQADTMNFPGWCDLERLPIIPATAKRLAPPKSVKAAEFANSIGVLMLAKQRDDGFGTHLITTMLLAATMSDTLRLIPEVMTGSSGSQV